jgi:polysaccharide pyruvyl transferase WcaK-like protein
VSVKSSGVSATNIVVYGWYHQENLGDDLFIEAFKSLFPTFTFNFVNQITVSNLENADAVFIGGGSFLGEPLIFDADSWNLLLTKKIFYLGVGAETNIHPSHYQLLKMAKLVAIRSPSALKKMKTINDHTTVIPDLVYHLFPKIAESKIENSVLVLPNMVVVPSWNDPHWMHAAWDYFKTEFAQFLDGLVRDGFQLNFLPLCTNSEFNDELAASEIIGRMQLRSNQYFLEKKNDFQSITELMSRYNVVITQRYHGIVLAEMSQTSCLTIHHHDKLKTTQGFSLPFYGLTKDMLRSKFDQAKNAKVTSILPIDRDTFEILQRAVGNALCGD